MHAALPEAVLQGKLAALWVAVTGDSHYTAKIGEIVHWPLLVRAYIDYARRRRLIVTFGSCYGSAAEAVLAAAEAEQPTQERTDVEDQPCPACGAVGTLRHDSSRRWRMESVAPIGGGWYVPCRSVEDWRAIRARRVGSY